MLSPLVSKALCLRERCPKDLSMAVNVCRYVKDYKLPQGAADAMKPALDQALKQASDLLAAEEQDDVVTLSRRPAGAPDVPAKKAKTDS